MTNVSSYTNITNPLDFEEILSYAIGDMQVAVYILAIGFSILAAKYNMPVGVYGLLMGVFFIIMMIAVGNTFAVLSAIALAIGLYITFSRHIKN